MCKIQHLVPLPSEGVPKKDSGGTLTSDLSKIKATYYVT